MFSSFCHGLTPVRRRCLSICDFIADERCRRTLPPDIAPALSDCRLLVFVFHAAAIREQPACPTFFAAFHDVDTLPPSRLRRHACRRYYDASFSAPSRRRRCPYRRARRRRDDDICCRAFCRVFRRHIFRFYFDMPRCIDTRRRFTPPHCAMRFRAPFSALYAARRDATLRLYFRRLFRRHYAAHVTFSVARRVILLPRCGGAAACLRCRRSPPPATFIAQRRGHANRCHVSALRADTEARRERLLPRRALGDATSAS